VHISAKWSNLNITITTTTTPTPTTITTLTTTVKDNGVTTLTFRFHVTSSVPWPFDSRWSTSYGWSIVTMRLSGSVMDI